MRKVVRRVLGKTFPSSPEKSVEVDNCLFFVHYVFFYSFIKSSQAIKFTHLKKYSSVVFRIVTEL